jgi:hypothetical protein
VTPLTETGAIGPGAGLVAALAIGVAFGWCLERAGLGRATTLVGQFYLRNFVVLKVLFTALVTALLGSFWLDRIGVLRLDLVYLPETFLLPQALGGVLFGAGLIAAGLCPGTACAAAASGRVDGIGTVVGMLAGIAAFNAGYGWLQPWADQTAMGSVTLTDLAGVSYGAGVAVVTLGALAMFTLLERFERVRR